MGDPTKFEDYFVSELHNRRMQDAINRTSQRLAAIGTTEIFAAFSEAIGTIYGVGHFYRSLGLKHQGAAIFREVFNWMKKGAD